METASRHRMRPAVFEDAAAVAAALLAADLLVGGGSDYDEDFVRDQWSAPGFEPERDAWVVEGPDGAVIGGANVISDGEARMRSWGVVHPEHRGRGIGSALLDRIEGRAAERLQGVDGASLSHSIDSVDGAARAMLLERGYAFGRSYRRMQLDLDGARDLGQPPRGIEIRGIDPDVDLARAHAVFVEAFADEWGYRVIPYAEWRELEVETPDFDPSLWLLATESGEAVGALNGSVWGDRGWIGELGVRAGWRGRGIGSALLNRAFATFAERGLPRAMLNVDFENPTGAMALYEKVGMRVASGFDVYERSVPSGSL